MASRKNPQARLQAAKNVLSLIACPGHFVDNPRVPLTAHFRVSLPPRKPFRDTPDVFGSALTIVKAPWPLGLFGEDGYMILSVPQSQIDRAYNLFPEAQIATSPNRLPRTPHH